MARSAERVFDLLQATFEVPDRSIGLHLQYILDWNEQCWCSPRRWRRSSQVVNLRCWKQQGSTGCSVGEVRWDPRGCTLTYHHQLRSPASHLVGANLDHNRFLPHFFCSENGQYALDWRFQDAMCCCQLSPCVLVSFARSVDALSLVVHRPQSSNPHVMLSAHTVSSLSIPTLPWEDGI